MTACTGLPRYDAGLDGKEVGSYPGRPEVKLMNRHPLCTVLR